MNESLERIQGELAHVKILYMADILAGFDPLGKMDELRSLTDIPEIRLGQILAEGEDEVEKMAKNLGVKINNAQDREVDQAIAMEIKDFSLFYGTMDSLLDARDIAHVLDAVEKGLEIIFHVPRIFFFFPDRDKEILTGTCNGQDRHHNIVRSIALPMDSQSSLLVKSLVSDRILSCLGREGLAVSDAQIIRLLESKGLYCIPITAKGNAMGVMALGVDEQMVAALNRNQGLLRLFSRQTGTCLENLEFHQTYATDMNEKKMEAYAALTDKVIHEINNPISIIRNYLETLKLKLPDKHPVQDELSVVGEEMYRVSSLVEGLSSFSKPKIGGLEIINLNQVCSRVLEVLKKSILLPRQINLTLVFDKEIPAFKMDGNGFKQVLINLVKNAAEAMTQGGEIHVKTRLLPGSAKVLIDEKKKIPGFVEISIQDTGPGISPTIRERLFEPYNSSKTNGTNSGLGLAIVHSIIKEMKGKITCDSEEGCGTCFKVCLPLALDRQVRPARDAIHG